MAAVLLWLSLGAGRVWVAVAAALPGWEEAVFLGLCSLQSPSPLCLVLEVLGQSRRSSLSRCQQCLSVTSSVLLSLFVSPIITALTVGECRGHCPC